MSCARFDRWLDAGRPEADAPVARSHARDCARCSAALDAALELEVALGVVTAAPAGFTDRVMARVAAVPQLGAPPPIGAAALVALPALPWWVRAAMEPPALLAAVLAALLLGWGPALMRGALALQSRLGAAPLAPLGGALDATAWTTIALLLLPPIGWLSWRMYRFSETLTARAAGR